MLFVHDNPVHVNIRTDDRDDKGRLIRGGKRRLYAKFTRGTAPEWAVQQAASIFQFKSMPENLTPAQWLAAYDSQSDGPWNPDERKIIEDELVFRGYLAVEPEKLKAPYPMYDKHRKVSGRRTVEHAIKDITAAYESAGFDVDAAVAYEQENGNDPSVVAALLGLKDARPEVEEDPLIAA